MLLAAVGWHDSIVNVTVGGAVIFLGLGLIVNIAVILVVGGGVRGRVRELGEEVERLRRGLGIPED